MPQWIPLSRTQHAESFYLPRQDNTFAASQVVTPILLAELNKLLPHYALGFVKQGASFQAVALLGLDNQNNLYLDNEGRWRCSYTPAFLRGYPFTMASDQQNKKVFAIDQDYLSEEHGVPLFDDAGRLSYKVQKSFEFINRCEHNRQLTVAAMQTLANTGVIEPWPIRVNLGEQRELFKVNGIYRVSEKTLNALDTETYASLSGAPMALAHAQLFSMSQLKQLTEWATSSHVPQGGHEVPENLDSVLDGMDDDDLEFNFD